MNYVIKIVLPIAMLAYCSVQASALPKSKNPKTYTVPQKGGQPLDADRDENHKFAVYINGVILANTAVKVEAQLATLRVPKRELKLLANLEKHHRTSTRKCAVYEAFHRGCNADYAPCAELIHRYALERADDEISRGYLPFICVGRTCYKELILYGDAFPLPCSVCKAEHEFFEPCLCECKVDGNRIRYGQEHTHCPKKGTKAQSAFDDQLDEFLKKPEHQFEVKLIEAERQKLATFLQARHKK